MALCADSIPTRGALLEKQAPEPPPSPLLPASRASFPPGSPRTSRPAALTAPTPPVPPPGRIRFPLCPAHCTQLSKFITVQMLWLRYHLLCVSFDNSKHVCQILAVTWPPA